MVSTQIQLHPQMYPRVNSVTKIEFQITLLPKFPNFKIEKFVQDIPSYTHFFN